MIYLKLFFTFLKVGAFTFGGGYAMLSLIGNYVLSYGWMNEEELLNFLGMETVVPGPIAVNMSTYIGYEQGGFLGTLLATLGVVLPSFIIILIIAAFIKNLLQYPIVKILVESMKPALCGLILSVSITMGAKVFFKIDTIGNMNITFDWRSLIIFAIVIAIPFLWKKFKKHDFSSILLVAISGVLGILLF